MINCGGISFEWSSEGLKHTTVVKTTMKACAALAVRGSMLDDGRFARNHHTAHRTMREMTCSL